MKTYRYLYYKLYCIWLKKKDEPENARINAVITITFLLYVNIVSIPLILLAIHKNEIINLPEIGSNVKIWIGLILVGAGIMNYFILARKKEHAKIIEEFKMENKSKRKKGMVYTILYLIVSFGIPLYIFLFTTPK
ncbi:MAG: hypothetical protein HN704_15250 [Bacteroidetes bacterium]|jgi:hypothetical protein|nr:hypothetical protein [Bacteroidota bacterium]MBT7143421.1 hypothetical protein [Bacteroidota bacterium]MBT7492954.1 hypothetical protein [Bacteroidota bacterium]